MTQANGRVAGVSNDPAIFCDSDVPISSLFDHFAGGGNLDAYLARFSAVKRSQALAVLELARQYWGKAGPKGWVENPDASLLQTYQQMCQEYSGADFDRDSLSGLAEARDEGLS